MSCTVFINVYESYIDRGATVNKTPSEHYEIDEEDIRVYIYGVKLIWEHVEYNLCLQQLMIMNLSKWKI